jgi:mannose-6-phosphate isomerase-like protein (cupin superfamily)
LLAACAPAATSTTPPSSATSATPHAFAPTVTPLRGGAPYQPILEGPPGTRGMESGRVEIAPGETGHLHSTKSYEEAVTILAGSGELRVPGAGALPFAAPCVLYVPPETSHAVANTGKEPLIYVFVAAPSGR